MNLYTSKSGKKIVCITKNELWQLYKAAKGFEIASELSKRGLTLEDMRKDFSKMEELSTIIGERGAQDRDEHEIFASLFVFSDFYGPDTQTCFELVDSFDSDKNRISSLEDLIRFRKIDSDSDFLLMTDGKFRSFQLKRFRGPFDIEPFFAFIKKIVLHYGNSLGNTNLLIQLQPPAGTVTKMEFKKLHALLTAQGYKFDTPILVSYNEEDKHQLIIEVYPHLRKTSIPIRYPSTRKLL